MRPQSRATDQLVDAVLEIKPVDSKINDSIYKWHLYFPLLSNNALESSCSYGILTLKRGGRVVLSLSFDFSVPKKQYHMLSSAIKEACVQEELF